jgi:hypothetical protein
MAPPLLVPAAALHGGCDALLSNDKAFQMEAAPFTLLRLEPDPPQAEP